MVALFQLFIALYCAFFVAASPVDTTVRDRMIYPRTTDWGNYVYISSISTGIVGQNLAAVASPGNRAACPAAIWDIQTCSQGWVSECLDERTEFEWCLQNVITIDTCGHEWLNMTLGCMGESSAYCVETLITLNNCATAITIPSGP